MTETDEVLEFIKANLETVVDPDGTHGKTVEVYYGTPTIKEQGNRISYQLLGDPTIGSTTRGREAEREISMSISIFSMGRVTLGKIASSVMRKMDAIRGQRGAVTERQELDTGLWTRIMTYRFTCRNNTIL